MLLRQLIGQMHLKPLPHTRAAKRRCPSEMTASFPTKPQESVSQPTTRAGFFRCRQQQQQQHIRVVINRPSAAARVARSPLAGGQSRGLRTTPRLRADHVPNGVRFRRLRLVGGGAFPTTASRRRNGRTESLGTRGVRTLNCTRPAEFASVTRTSRCQGATTALRAMQQCSVTDSSGHVVVSVVRIQRNLGLRHTCASHVL